MQVKKAPSNIFHEYTAQRAVSLSMLLIDHHQWVGKNIAFTGNIAVIPMGNMTMYHTSSIFDRRAVRAPTASPRTIEGMISSTFSELYL
jgi:hypothetical protein